ncbi:hypothetical protein AB0C69_25745 [Actinomadura sp. NPDC048032]|uniref:hypothetical protein n=1 Tax=Actinomadura sp. NPDC048032 TaxID=3155747 RepID=UPI0033CE62C7
MKMSAARAIDRLVVLAATVTLASKQYGFPSGELWKDVEREYPYVLVTLILIAGFFGVATPSESWSQRLRVERRLVMRRHVLTAFGQLIEVCSAVAPAIAVSDLGLHIWQRKRNYRHPLRGELTRVATYRLGASPATRRIHPTPGVGVVGLCWKHDQEVGVDVSALARDLVDEDAFTSFRAREGADAVMGFSWEEFQRYRHRGAVFATPIRNGRARFVGCVSFDVSHGYDSLNAQRIWHILNSLTFVVGEDGFENV